MSHIYVNYDNTIHTRFSLDREQVNRYHKDGFLLLPSFFELREIKPLQTIIDRDSGLQGKQTIRYDAQNRIYKHAVWTELGNTLLGVMPRLARIVDAVELLLGEECYHWHSKIVTKDPGGGGLAWHQDYAASWYDDGCLFPRLVNCLIALSESNQKSGCLKLVTGSHLLGRLNVSPDCPYGDSDPDRVKKILQRLDVVDCEMKPGDVLFFHCNTLHSSEPNNSNKTRNLMYFTYNAVSNKPFFKEGQEHHRYVKLDKLPDSTIEDGKYDLVFENHKFLPTETLDNHASGIFYRTPKT